MLSLCNIPSCILISLCYNVLVRQEQKLLTKGSEDMDEMATNTEYILRMVLELIDKCKTLDELREAVKKVLDEAK